MNRFTPPPLTRILFSTLVAGLVVMVAAAPVAAQSPEVWLSHEGSGQGWSKGRVSFNLTCPASPTPNPILIGSYNATEPHHYRASTFFQVEARNVSGNAGDQEMLPSDHPGRAWGKTMWCELWGGCTLVYPKEIDIMLSVTPPGNITMKDSRGATGTEFMVTRGDGTWPNSVAISHSQTCPSFNHSWPVRITARIVAVRELRP